MPKISMAAARMNAKLSQEQIAEKMGISRAYYADIENGKKEVKPVYFYAFCHITGFSEDDILLPNEST